MADFNAAFADQGAVSAAPLAPGASTASVTPSAGPAEAVEPNYLDGGLDGPVSDRGADGRFVPGNQAARRLGLYARQQPAEHQDAVARLAAGIITDLGGESELSTLERAYIGRLADVELTLRLLAADIARRGLLTHRGGVRRVYDSLLAGIDRWDRLAQRLGLRRRARPVLPGSPMAALKHVLEHGLQESGDE